MTARLLTSVGLVVWVVVALVLPVPATASSPPVTANVFLQNVRAHQEEFSGDVVIMFDLYGSTPATLRVEFWDGTRWREGLAVAPTIIWAPGADLVLRWRAREDAELFAAEARVRLTATSGPYNASAESAPFRLDTLPPIGCGCLEPPDGARHVPLQPVLKAVRSVIDDSPIDGYQFRLARDPNFTHDVVMSPWQSVAIWIPMPLERRTTYWWSVRARDRYGNTSAWAYPFHFTTQGWTLYIPHVVRR